MLAKRMADPSWIPILPTPRMIRVLLLDDSTFDRARIRRLSQRTALALDLEEVSSIAQLDRLVAEAHFDVALIDYRLPEGDGIEALNVLRRQKHARAVGKVMITGDGGPRTADKALKAGCDAYLAKEDMTADALRHAILDAIAAARVTGGDRMPVGASAPSGLSPERAARLRARIGGIIKDHFH
ncbi:MAG: response regulator [Pseudomonadota bacterium]